MNTEMLQQFLTMTLEKRKHEQEAKALASKIAVIEPLIIEEFAADGMQRTTLQGHTVYLNRQMLSSVVSGEMPAVCLGLEAVGAGDLVKESVNSATLSAWVRERERDADDMPILPPELAGLVKVYERFSMRVIKA